MKGLGGFSALLLLGSSPLFCLAADRVVFARLAPSEATLYVANADGSGEHALTQPGSLNYNPAWSSKGDWIAFTSEREGSADLFRMHPDGSGVERLTDNPAYDDQAAFSSDGKQIVFVSTRAAGFANLWILDVATHAAKPLTSGHGGDFRPAWSPDGKWIAFSSDRDSDLPMARGRWERLQVVDIYLVHPDGSGLKRITQHGDFCGTPKWTEDSKSVVAYCMSAQETWSDRAGAGEMDDRVVKIDIESGAITPLAAGPGVKLAPTILASGDIAYMRQDKKAHGISYASGKQGPAGYVMFPAWSPDGERVVYSRWVNDRSAVPHKLWSRDKHFDLSWTGVLPAYDPSGANLAVTRIDGLNSTTLLVFDDVGKSRTLLHRDELILAPQWSPDGKQVTFGIGKFSAFLDFDAGEKKPVDPVNGGAQVGVINADGTSFHLITAGPNNNAFPSFSPDGKHIVYRTAGPGEDGLRIMNLEDKSIVKLTSDWDNFPIWSPPGDLIAFVRRTAGGDFEVFTIHPDGTGLKQLTNIHGNEAHLAWSPDGKRLLFTSSRMGFKDETLYTGAPQPYGEIFVMNRDGSQVEQLTDDQWEEGVPAWQPHRAGSAAAGTH
jgi:Tol biopolymer transport system component